MSTHLLTRRSQTDAPHIPLFEGVGLSVTRTHEFCGNARRTLAMILASRMQGPVFWLQPTWQTEQLHTDALTRFLNPGRLFLVYLNKGEDILWTMEEVLRSGAVPLVVADLPEPPGLTAVRRLHLAAETGSEEGKVAPLGLLLAPSTGGAAGVESRWGLTQAHAPDHLKWHLHRHRARREPQKSWIVEPKGRRFALKPFTGSDADVTL